MYILVSHWLAFIMLMILIYLDAIYKDDVLTDGYFGMVISMEIPNLMSHCLMIQT